MKQPTDEAKLAFLAGLSVGLEIDKRFLTEKRKSEIEKHGSIGSQAVFGGGAFNPLVVWEATDYFDKNVRVGQ